MIPDAVVAALEATMESTCVVTRPGVATWSGTEVDAGEPTVVFAGPCSLLPAGGGRTGSGGDDRTFVGPVVRLPLAADGLVRPGDLVVVDDVHELVVANVVAATHRAQVRLECAATMDAPGVPR